MSGLIRAVVIVSGPEAYRMGQRYYWEHPVTMREAREWLHDGPFRNVAERDLRFEYVRKRKR